LASPTYATRACRHRGGGLNGGSGGDSTSSKGGGAFDASLLSADELERMVEQSDLKGAIIFDAKANRSVETYRVLRNSVRSFFAEHERRFGSRVMPLLFKSEKGQDFREGGQPPHGFWPGARKAAPTL
jgi:hypothetical protein